MGSNSSSNSFDPEKYGEFQSLEDENKYNESDIIVTQLYWRDVPMTNKNKENWLNFARAATGYLSEMKLGGKDISHDIIVVITNKGPNFVLEWLGDIMLRPGYYGKYCHKRYFKARDYTPKNMTLSDLRKIMNDNPGEGDCKDHAKLWWRKIKEKY